MKSIKTKFLVLITISVLLCTTIIAAVGVVTAITFTKQITTYYLPTMCDEQQNKINIKLEKIRQTVDLFAYTAIDKLGTVKNIKNPTSRNEYKEYLSQFSSSILKKTDGAKSLYFRFNPELSDYDYGIFLEKQGAIVLDTTPNDFSKETVTKKGVFYKTVQSQDPIWTPVSFNEMFNVDVFSYIIPIVMENNIVGFIGMDIDFEYIKDSVSKNVFFKTGCVYLKDNDNFIIYHPTKTVGEKVIQNSDIYELSKELINGMNVVVNVPYIELSDLRNKILFISIALTLLIGIIYILIALKLSGAIVKPLRELNEAAKKISFGNLDIKLNIKSDNEIGELARSFEKTTASLKHYVDYINGLAYKDSLTGAKNKTAYDNAIQQLMKDVEDGVLKEYAIAVFDANGLKQINDNYGHDIGNMLIINSYKLISGVFEKSLVFRIGGDEFAAIMKDDDYQNRYELEKLLAEKSKATLNNQIIHERVSIACGIADYEPSMTVQDVFKKADGIMYENKKIMKAKMI